MASSTALDWLYGTQLFGVKLGLDNVHRLLTALELPADGQRFIHVAGTNGKGSTCAFMHSVLRAGGVRAGLFTSPHLIRFNERIRDGERMISDTEIEDGLQRLRVLVQAWDPHPTFFELAFALAMDWFRQRGLEWVILETGMGGRLDATNAITPAVCVITSIGWDHQEILGESLAKIAGEKAGIIKPNVPVVTQAQLEEAQSVIEKTAAQLNAPLRIVEPWTSRSALGLPGPHQRSNAALAIAALNAVGLHIDEDKVNEGLATVDWPGRFQRIGSEGGRIVIDGAHNLEAAEMLVRTWQETYPGEKATVIFGVAGDKDAAAMLRTLAPIVAEWRFTGFRSPRAMPAVTLQRVWESLQLAAVPTSTHTAVAEALNLPSPQRKLIAGSLYLAGETLALLEGNPERFETSLQ
jgi:dihydrofolate synthase/folylpolyglutamate synthase